MTPAHPGRPTVIRVKDLVKSFDGRRILNGVTLDVFEGETMVIMGGSGCGKSTLLRHLIGSLTPDSGEVWMCGTDIVKADEDQMHEIRQKFGMLFQSGGLFDSMTVGDNIALPLREHTKLDDSIIRIMVRMKLELVGLSGFEDLMPSQLSGGMKKRVGLARAIALDPKIVFYDEPTAGLDPVMTGVVDKLTVDLTRQLGITSVVVTHDMNSVFRIADRIVMLHKGEVLQIGTPDEIRHSKDPVIRQFIAGDPEGPISFLQRGDGYLDKLTA